jgi:hypothetical protein
MMVVVTKTSLWMFMNIFTVYAFAFSWDARQSSFIALTISLLALRFLTLATSQVFLFVLIYLLFEGINIAT